ncbi:hypothetical protein AB0B50_43900 [Streptomyces sp. NPDC041068]|uniref:hypothetical protein n=1 Tax=Streptomyces sp. NPDC041068 TaxID=3155130 RepID=UPI0033E9C8AD
MTHGGQAAHGGQSGHGGYGYGGQSVPGDASYAGRSGHGGAHAAPVPQQSHGAHAAPMPQPTPTPQQGPGGTPYAGQQGQGAHGAHAGHGAQPLPPAASAQPLPAGQGAQPLPPVAVPGAPSDSEATQYIAPVPTGGVDEGATQYIPPVGPGALPPEAPAADATQFLGRANAPVPGAAPAATPDSEPTQFIAPVPGGNSGPGGTTTPPEPAAAPYGIRPGAPGDRQPPAEFDSLFRTEPEAEGPASTQQMPRFEAPAPAPAPAPGGHGGGGRRGGGGRSKATLIGVIGVGIAALGIGAGALLSSGGGDDDEKKDEGKPVAASAEPDERPSPTADPAKDQAVALDKLLADSNNSRDSVIAAVRNVGKCQNLGQSAKDLRAAAKQRSGLVTRLAALKVDKLPANDQLTASLNRAWKASAAADNHYAAWADQVAGKKGCKKGHARNTPQTVAGNKQSNAATTAKGQAANHWNAIARKYGLTERNKTQL